MTLNLQPVESKIRINVWEKSELNTNYSPLRVRQALQLKKPSEIFKLNIAKNDAKSTYTARY